MREGGRERRWVLLKRPRMRHRRAGGRAVTVTAMLHRQKDREKKNMHLEIYVFQSGKAISFSFFFSVSFFFLKKKEEGGREWAPTRGVRASLADTDRNQDAVDEHGRDFEGVSQAVPFCRIPGECCTPFSVLPGSPRQRRRRRGVE